MAKEPPAKTTGPKQSTLASFFGAPKRGPRPSQSKSSQPQSSPASSKPPASSAAGGSSPALPRTLNKSSVASSNRASSPVKQPELPSEITVVEESDDELSPLPKSDASVSTKVASSKPTRKPVGKIDEDEEMDEDDAPVVTGRRGKRKVVYMEDTDSSEDDVPAKSSKGRKPRKSMKEDSEDEFVIDEAEEAAMAAALDDYESKNLSPSKSASGSPSPPPSPPQKIKAKPKPKAVPKKAAASRPAPKPTQGGQSESHSFLTTAERKKLQAKEDKRDGEQCFDFLTEIKDKEGNRPEDPDYDNRSIHIPKSSWQDFTPFEKQFWEIKQNHYDTVLFFQKGKFYELYEDDAMIGHQEFDLKLTDRVKMKMVGVPEQSLEFWIAKFLAGGHKVGIVEQAETAIGMEMRMKSGTKGGGKEIVRRELKRVFTNGTIVDGEYLSSDDPNHLVSIKESVGADGLSSFGICVADASTGEFTLTAFDDDISGTRLDTMFRQVRPKELVHAKGNLSVNTTRLLRNILPSSTSWQSFKDVKEFYTAEETLRLLPSIFGEDGAIPEAVTKMQDNELAMESLGGILFYLKSLNLDKDLFSQKNFNIYDPIREGKYLILDGKTLGHMEVLVNNEGGVEGTLLELLQRCGTPSGKRLFHIWLRSPLREVSAINARLDAVEDLMNHPRFAGDFTLLCKGLPDLERLVSRIHAGSVKQNDFLKVVETFGKLQKGLEGLLDMSDSFDSTTIKGLLRQLPDLSAMVKHIRGMYHIQSDEKTIAIAPNPGADEDCDNADAEVERIEGGLDELLSEAKKTLKCKDLQYWHSAQGGKEIFQIQAPASVKVPAKWTKQSGTKNFSRYYTPDSMPVIRQLQEARETQTAARRDFFKNLLAEFSKDREVWLKAVRIVAELDCLISLAKASSDMDEPKCRPELIESDSAFIDFKDLRHPSMCLRADFIPNDVQLGGEVARIDCITGPNMAGKSTLLRMTAAGVIMSQLGCLVPAESARLSPVDKIQTRMGAYDNMFASASTFKVELDECSRILREATPKSLVILDELGRGTSTFDGMAIAGAVLHEIATHTLPLGFFATHYGSLTDDFAYHPNIRNMHMQTHVDDEQKLVVFLYKLIPGVAESSHGTHVARMAGVPADVVQRAESVSSQFFDDFNQKLSTRRQSKLPIVAQADFAWLMRVASGDEHMLKNGTSLGGQLDVIRRAVGSYELS
ncbi:hypothetical protein L202_06063 [Cryptococcus amylolentus CBS 6039]|uniref:DNA mismatch repair protein n=1 Tax=Cryptococcus amylolentus CBS 6039 TaxID=1295533 RepID=A0A1E3HIF5_9TREE|nr:hypothetical protein L202_06063 [Cryptococcus amylolentus CBS 6039]ODN76137.1 hypothetical protein L202_06063 [Cryptococcus amylolentus CBS 6039]